MFKITQEQHAALAQAPQHVFLKKMQVHLEETSRMVCGTSNIDFRSAHAMERLRSEMNLLLYSGIEYAQDVAAAIECFEIFHVDKNCDEVIRILRSNTSSADKLDQLFELRKRATIS